MHRVRQIETRVTKLSREELATFRAWFRRFDGDRWDREIEADVRAGRLDCLVDAAHEQHRKDENSDL